MELEIFTRSIPTVQSFAPNGTI